MKDFKRKWESELEEFMPKLDKSIIDEPIPTKEAHPIKAKKNNKLRYMSFACSIAAAIVLCICIIPLLRIKDNQNLPLDNSSGNTLSSYAPPISDNGGYDGTQETVSGTIITVEINPRVMVLSDKNGIVTNIVATNSDADVVLSSEGFLENVIGKRTSEALVLYVDCATKLGYIDADSTENTVKITFCETDSETEDLLEIKENLETHFKTKGIYAVVVDKKATLEEVCQINELEKSEKIDEVVDNFKNKSPLFAQRKLEKLNDEEIQAYYKETVMKGISSNIKGAIDEASAILKIADINRQLEELCYANYWVLKEIPIMDQAVQDLVNEIETELALLEKNYGRKIENGYQLYQLTAKFTNETLEKLLNNLENFDNSEHYKELYEALERDTGIFDSLDNIPTTKDEIMKEQEKALQQESNNRMEKHKESYEKERNEIDKDKYDSFVDEMKNKLDKENQKPSEEDGQHDQNDGGQKEEVEHPKK